MPLALVVEKTCTNKVAYMTRGEAAMGAQDYMSYVSAPVDRMAAYKCPFCPDWHITHTISADPHKDPATYQLVEKDTSIKPKKDLLRARKERQLRRAIQSTAQAKKRMGIN